METQKKQLRDNILKSLIMLYACENDELKGHQVIEYKTQDNNGNIMVTATLKRIGSKSDVNYPTAKAIGLFLAS